MKGTTLSLISFICISLLPVSILTVYLRENMSKDEMNLCVISGILFCMAGIIILVAGSGSGLLTKYSKVTGGWIFLLLLSTILLFVLAIPSIEIYLGINMPFFRAGDHEFNYLGYDIEPGIQIGFMLLTGVLMMLPVRTLHLAMMKLAQNKKQVLPSILY